MRVLRHVLELTETGSPGTFDRSGVPTGKFDCNAARTLPFGLASNNGKLEFPVFVSADCFGAPGTVTGQLTAWAWPGSGSPR